MQKIPVLTLTAVAAAAIVKLRFLDHDGTPVDVEGSKPLGVACTDANIGDAVAVDVLGTTKVEAGGAIPLGPKGLTPVKSAADGRAIAHAGVGEVAGYARQPASGAGAVIEILLTP